MADPELPGQEKAVGLPIKIGGEQLGIKAGVKGISQGDMFNVPHQGNEGGPLDGSFRKAIPVLGGQGDASVRTKFMGDRGNKEGIALIIHGVLGSSLRSEERRVGKPSI